MAAAAPPRGRPQYAAPRAEIASSASGGRQTTPPSSSAQRSPSARLFPHSRLVETGGRRHPPAARRNVRSAHLRCRWRRPVPLGTRHGPSGRETFSVRAPWEIISDKLIVYRFDFLLRRGARTHRVFCWPTGCNLHCPRAGGDWPKQLMLFGQSPTPAVARGSSYPDEQGLPYAGGGPYAGRAVPPGTRHWPFGRENILCPRAGGYWPKQLTLFDQYPTPAVARGCRSALESWSWLGNRRELPLRRAGAPTGRFIGLAGEKNGQKQPRQNALWACRSAPYRAQPDCLHELRLNAPRTLIPQNPLPAVPSKNKT